VVDFSHQLMGSRFLLEELVSGAANLAAKFNTVEVDSTLYRTPLASIRLAREFDVTRHCSFAYSVLAREQTSSRFSGFCSEVGPTAKEGFDGRYQFSADERFGNETLNSVFFHSCHK